jgi:hypothetical protein
LAVISFLLSSSDAIPSGTIKYHFVGIMHLISRAITLGKGRQRPILHYRTQYQVL